MKKHLLHLGSIFLSLSFGAHALGVIESPLMVCSGLHENGSRANVEITKFWHHLEPGMDPAPRYELVYTYIGENSIGFWDHAGSKVKGSVSFSDSQMMDAVDTGKLSVAEKQSNVVYYFNFDLDVSTKKATISHRSGKSVAWEMALDCTGDIG